MKPGFVLVLAALCAGGARAEGPAPAASQSPAGEEVADTPSLGAVVEGERRTEPAAAVLRGSEAAGLAGAHGDPLVAAQMLPGVAREGVGSGQLVVWGAAPRDTRLLIDGIEVPALYHGGGLRSVVPGELVKRLELAPAAFGPQYGRALGGVLAAEVEAPPADAAHLRASVDPLDVHAAGETPLGSGRLLAGARYSLLDRLLGPLLSTTARELFPLPRYWDGQLVATFPLRDGERLDVLLLGASDSAQRALDAGDPTLARGDSSVLRWGRLGARYRRELEGGGDASVVLWIGDEFESASTFTGPASAAQSRWAQSGGLRAAVHTSPAPGLELTVGTDSKVTHTHLRRLGSLTTPAREGDVVAFGEAPGADVAFDDWTVDQGELALHAAADATLGPLTVAPGVRLSAIATDASRLSPRLAQTSGIGSSQLEWFLEPRLALSLHLSERVRLSATAGLHHQPASPEDLSAVFGRPALSSSSAVHASAGAAWRPPAPLELEATGFFRSLDGLAVRSPLPTPLLAQALVQQGTGRSYGVQLVARSSPAAPLSGFVSALISRSERQDSPGAAVRPFDFDQPFSVTGAASYRMGDYLFAARLRVSAGYPRTPVIGSYLDSRLGLYDPIFGAQNSERLGLFAQADLRVDRELALGDGRKLRLSLEVLNAAARSNPEEFVYSSDWSSRGVISGLPAMALLGAELSL